MNEKRYRAVLFDLGGTLRIALEDEPYMRHARRKMTELAGAPLQVEDFYQLVEDRYESYRRWALGENKEAGDRELWCRWLLPDYDQKRIAQVCHELSFEYRQSKGRRVVVDGGAEVIRTLHERGYKLGIVSNLIGEHEVPDWLEEDRLAPYFGSVGSPPCAICASLARRFTTLQPGNWGWIWQTASPWRTTSSEIFQGPRLRESAATSSSGLRRRGILWSSRRRRGRMQ